MLLQAAVVTAGIIAIVVFKEVTGKREIVGFLSCGVLLICGAALLANFGRCK